MNARLLCFLALSLLSAPDVRAQQVKLTATLMVPISHPILGASLVRFKEEVEKSSNNTVSIEIVDKAQLFGATEVVGAVSSGPSKLALPPTISQSGSGSSHYRPTLPVQFFPPCAPQQRR